MQIILLIIASFFVAWLISLPIERKKNKRLQKYWSRSCTGREWLSQFPTASKESIREFLDVFVDSFLFSSDKRLKFSPQDKLIDVYNTLYTPYSVADACEVETFAADIEKRYGVDIFEIEEDEMTLGKLFALTSNPNESQST